MERGPRWTGDAAWICTLQHRIRTRTRATATRSGAGRRSSGFERGSPAIRRRHGRRSAEGRPQLRRTLQCGRRGSSEDWRNACGSWCGSLARAICWTRSSGAPCNAGRPWSSRSRGVDCVSLARIPREAKRGRAPCLGAAPPTGRALRLRIRIAWLPWASGPRPVRIPSALLAVQVVPAAPKLASDSGGGGGSTGEVAARAHRS